MPLQFLPLSLSLLAWSASAETNPPTLAETAPTSGLDPRIQEQLEVAARAFAAGIVTSDSPYYTYLVAGQGLPQGAVPGEDRRANH